MSVNGLWHSLANLDARLQSMVAAAITADPRPAADPLRGLSITAADATRSLQAPSWPPMESTLAHPEFTRLSLLSEAFALQPFESDALLIALAPEIDARYERLYAYLQDDVSRRRPSTQLILDLLCPSLEAMLACRSYLTGSAPLVRNGLIHVVAEPASASRWIEVDEQISNFLLGIDRMDSRVADFCQLIRVESRELPPPLQGVPELFHRTRDDQRSLVLYIRGARGSGRRSAAEAVAGSLGAGFLAVDLERAANSPHDFRTVLEWVRREAWMRNAIRYFEGTESMADPANWEAFCEHLAKPQGMVIVSGSREWDGGGRGPLGVVTVNLRPGEWKDRREQWRRSLSEQQLPAPHDAIDMLATSFRLTPSQIRDACHIARNHSLWKGLHDADVVTELFAAARRQTGHELSTLARRIEPSYTWSDLVLPPDSIAQLKELCLRVTCRHTVFDEWGFDRRLSLGKGANALFAGASGTGKTMAAEVIAADLGLHLYKIDLAGVVSKYIGETEKNLDRVFTAASTANAILFFDEADALFGKRSEVRDSHDRYANLEISYLLQKMEEYDGIAILATNLKQNMDDAFVRRLAFTIIFPFPDAGSREQIWRRVWPAAIPLSSKIDFRLLAEEFQLSGGNIRNIALAAAFEAATDSRSPVTMDHILYATRREYQKLGRPLLDSEIPEYGEMSAPSGRMA